MIMKRLFISLLGFVIMLLSSYSQLPGNPSGKQSKEATSGFYNETYRPQFHFSPKVNWTNDPNGLVFFKGEYHLFFQHNPTGINWGNMTWGHAVSRDLVHWTQLSNAIEPDKLGAIFSGSAIVDRENTSGFGKSDSIAMVCIYTAAGGQSPLSGGQPFTQCLAYSTDGRRFTKYPGNPVLGLIAKDNRDPKVIWYAPERKWVMALFTFNETYTLFESKDLKSWKKLQDIKFPSRDGQCPDFFPMPVEGNKKDHKWILQAGNGDYMTGSFDGRTFRPESDTLRADYGANYYATQTYSDIPATDGRRIQIAWMEGGIYPGMPFNQQMNFPCEMKLRSFPEGLRICRLPVEEIKSLYGKKYTSNNLTIKSGNNLLKDVSGGLYDIQMKVDLAGADEFGIRCRGEAVKYLATKKRLISLGREAPADAPDGQITLRILVDRTSLEVYANDGKVVMTSCFLPDKGNTGLELYSNGGSPKIMSMTVFELKSAWPSIVSDKMK